MGLLNGFGSVNNIMKAMLVELATKDFPESICKVITEVSDEEAKLFQIRKTGVYFLKSLENSLFFVLDLTLSITLRRSKL